MLTVQPMPEVGADSGLFFLAFQDIAYARSLNPDKLVAVTVVSDPEDQERITQQWEDHKIPVELRALYSPYREIGRASWRERV